ncbi:hypothetical protein [Belnapia mucosa]|nr:hypothetical protein [Belnapia mucosa]
MPDDQDPEFVETPQQPSGTGGGPAPATPAKPPSEEPAPREPG